MKHRYIDPSCSPCKPKDIMSYMQQDFGVDMSYKKAWRSRQAALSSLFGTDDASYRSLPKFMYMWSTNNPGSSFDLVTTPRSHRFKYFFMSFSAWKRGWKYLRPVVIIDDTFLKSYYKGTLFSACGMDANEQVYPLAFGAGDSESTESWVYFLTRLKEAIGERSHQVIVSDRNAGIINSVKKVFTNSDHGYCMFHLLKNVKNQIKGLSKEVNWTFYAAAKAYTYAEFEKYMLMIDEEDPRVRAYLQNDVGHEKWARSFYTEKRYSIMTSNNAESLNAMNVKPREFPIAKLFDFLRERMSKWFYERREKALGTLTILCVDANKKLEEYHAKSTGLGVRDRHSIFNFFIICFLL